MCLDNKLTDYQNNYNLIILLLLYRHSNRKIPGERKKKRKKKGKKLAFSPQSSLANQVQARVTLEVLHANAGRYMAPATAAIA